MSKGKMFAKGKGLIAKLLPKRKRKLG